MLHIIKTSLAKLITVQSEVELTEKLQFSYTIISQWYKSQQNITDKVFTLTQKCWNTKVKNSGK